MQEEVSQKTLALCINGGRISEKILKDAMVKLLAELERERRQDAQKTAEKKRQRQQKAAEKKEKKKAAKNRGRQSLKRLMGQGGQLSSIEITDKNIRSFERYAGKYHVDYSLKKDRSVSPPRYLVFFKAKDVEVMTAAFKEYTGWQLKKSRRPSVLEKLGKAQERIAGNRERARQKKRERGPEL